MSKSMISLVAGLLLTLSVATSCAMSDPFARDACSDADEASSFLQISSTIANRRKAKDEPGPTERFNVWPRPNSVVAGTHSATVSPTLRFAGDIAEAHVQAAWKRYRKLMFPHSRDNNIRGSISKITVTINNFNATTRDNNKGKKLARHPDSSSGEAEYVDEDYELDVSEKGIEITAQHPVGVQYALETLSQLITFDYDKNEYVTQAVLPLKVKDHPRYRHRGMLVDSSRHFIPVPLMKRVITAMSYTKMNRLHWHVTDAQSFPLDSDLEPDLARKGAWSKRERYTRGDVESIVKHADLHGIVVIPEFDMPGHTSSWGKARDDLMTHTVDLHGDANTGALNPLKEGTYELVNGLLKDWVGPHEHAAFYHSPYVHLGTDEVPMGAWVGLGEPRQLFRKFVGRVNGIAKSFGKEVILWEEAFKDDAAPAGSIVQVWLDRAQARRAAGAGHRVILSQGWYLDHLDETALAMYTRDLNVGVPDDLFLGGEACMWGETVDGGDMEQTIWPRAGAVAERLWTAEAEDWSVAKSRLAAFRCLLLERGIPVGTLEGLGRSTPPGPGSCGEQ